MSKPEKRLSLAGAAAEEVRVATAAAEGGWGFAGAAVDEAALAAVRGPGLEDPVPTCIPLNMSPPASGPAVDACNVSWFRPVAYNCCPN